MQHYYYRTSNMAEIDLVLQARSAVIPIEIKLSTTTPTRSLQAIEAFIREHALQFGIVINNAPETAWLSITIIQIPAACL